jgi:phosphoenolpyruvate carboxykinase (GTP)
VPITALVFGGRRRTLAPLVYQARDWPHGVLVGAGMASETTAAATGDVGVVRRDPMAMKPFAGYNFGDYWAHWLSISKRVKKLPGIFHVNWFRRDAEGRFLWPGYGENLRVLAWIIERCQGKAAGLDTPIGVVPARGALDFRGLGLNDKTVVELLAVDAAAWRQEADEVGAYLESYGERLPAALRAEVTALKSRLA